MRALLALLLCAALLPVAPIRPVAVLQSLCRNGFYLLQNSTLLRLDERAASRVTVAKLTVPVNAIVYIPGAELLYGIGDYDGRSHVVTIDGQGTVRDLGIVPKGLQGAYAGAGHGHLWHLRSHDDLVTVDTSTLQIVDRSPLSEAVTTGDWAWNPRDGKLYGLTSGERPKLIEVDPGTGQVNVRATLPRLPSGSSFGAVSIDSDGTLHALHNGTGRIYHLPLAAAERFSFSGEGLTASRSDAADCPSGWDFGDAPDSYRTRLASGGARHAITTVGTLTIGEAVTEEQDSNVDDGGDDGVAGIAIDATATSMSVTVAVRNTTGSQALLVGWHDLDLNGQFGSGERADAPAPAGASTVTLSWPQVSIGAGELSYLRLRLYGEQQEVGPDGPASGGEVEDHPITIVRAGSPRPRPEPPPEPEPSASPAPPAPTTPPPTRALTMPQPPQPPDRKRSPRLPITLSLFIGLLVPAIAVAARSHARRGSVR